MAVNQAAMRRRARIMRAVNVPMRAALSLPFATPLSGNLMLICYTGRNSGKAYRQPVSYVRDGDVLLSPGGGRWTLNLADGRPARIRLRGRDAPARPELVTDPAELERLLGVIAEKNPRAARFIPIPRRPDGRLDPDALDAALQHGFCIDLADGGPVAASRRDDGVVYPRPGAALAAARGGADFPAGRGAGHRHCRLRAGTDPFPAGPLGPRHPGRPAGRRPGGSSGYWPSSQRPGAMSLRACAGPQDPGA